MSTVSSSTEPILSDFFICLNSAIKAVNPRELIEKNVKIESCDKKDFLNISNDLIFPNSLLGNSSSAVNNKHSFLLDQNVYVLAFGKAALGMTIAIENLIGNKHIIRGIAILPYNDAKPFLSCDNPQKTSNEENRIYPVDNSKIDYFFGAKNNLPDMDSCKAAFAAHEMCKNLKENDLLLTLISGGGSALLSLPTDICSSGERVNWKNLELKQASIKTMVNAGVTINELNSVRSTLSELKAGKLAKLASKSQIVSLVISDVIHDPLEIIASGPTCLSLINSNNYEIALDIIRKYNISDKVPKEVFDYLIRREACKTSEVNQLENYRVFNYLIGSNKIATDGILTEITHQGYDVKIVLSNSVSGEAKLIGSIFSCLSFCLYELVKSSQNLLELSSSTERLIDACMKTIEKTLKTMSLEDPLLVNETLANLSLLEQFLFETLKEENTRKKLSLNKACKVCLIAGGETTVTGGAVQLMNTDTSKGGRCQEMALAFEYMNRILPDSSIRSSLLFSSFGSDGIDGPTDAAGAFYFKENTSQPETAEIREFLSRHDSYNYYLKHNRLIRIGSTGTNVSDIQILLIEF